MLSWFKREKKHAPCQVQFGEGGKTMELQYDEVLLAAALDRVVRCYAPRTQRRVAVHQLRRLLMLGQIDDAKEFAYRHMQEPETDEARDGPVGPEWLLSLEWSWLIGQKRGLPERIERFKKQAQTEQRWRELLQVHLPGNGPPPEEGLAEPLTQREHEMLELLDKGMSNQQIADRVHLSVPTVKWHFYKLFAKLQVKSRAAALAKARSLHLLR